MSQPKNFGPNESDPLGEPIKNIDQLNTIFTQSEKKPENFCIGIEHEFFAHDEKNNRPLQFDAELSIQTFFKYIIKNTNSSSNPFNPVLENNKIVALTSKITTIALEPGGQIEIAARPAPNISVLAKDLDRVVEILQNSGKQLGISLFAIGLHPTATRHNMAQVQKSRYVIMKKYMQKLDGLGLDMMFRSAAIQLNIDYACEQDMAQKMRLGAILSPLYSLLFASGAFLDTKPTKYYTQRSYIWQKTDPDRVGIPACIFEPNFSYSSWIQFALDIPMYFIRRRNSYIDLTHMSFRDYMKRGFNKYKATLRDFHDHLSTIFTEIRLKPFIELRSTDSVPVPYAKSFATLCWAHFYNQDCTAQLELLFKNTSHQDILNLQENIIHQGPQTKFLSKPVFEILELLYTWAQNSLQNSTRPNEAQYLEVLEPIIYKQKTIKSYIHDTFSHSLSNNISSLAQNCGAQSKINFASNSGEVQK